MISSRPDSASQRGSGRDDETGVGSRRRLHPIERDSGGKGLQKNLSLSNCGDYITWNWRQMNRRDPYTFLISPVRHYSASWNKELCETYRFRCGLSRVGTDQRSSVSSLGRLHCRRTWEQWIAEIQAWDRIRSATMQWRRPTVAAKHLAGASPSI